MRIAISRANIVSPAAARCGCRNTVAASTHTVDGQPKMEVRASSGNTFVSTNGRTELVFEQDHTGTVTTVKLTQWTNKANA